MSGGGLNSLTTLIKRLEAATRSLEDLASSAQTRSTQPYDQAPHDGPQAPAQTINGDDEKRSTPTASDISIPQHIMAFDEMIKQDLKPFADLSEALGGIVAEQGAAFCVAFKAQREVLMIASKAKEPSPTSPVFMDILKDLQHGIETVNNVRENNRKCPQEHHLAMVADGVGMLAWVTIKPSPDKYVSEVLGGAQFFGNKILTAYKDKEPTNVDWVRSFVKLAAALKAFIKQHYEKGLEWNSNGVLPEEALKSIKTGSPTMDSTAALNASRGGAPPPPPPPLPAFDLSPPPPPQSGPKPAASGGDMAAVFSQLNQGESVTAGLRKVDKSEMTHKNPELREKSTVPNVVSPASSTSSAKPSSTAAKKPPKAELDGNKWSIENFENHEQPIEINVERNHSVLISRCNKADVRLNGKANAVTINDCSRLDVLVDSLVSSVGVVNVTNFRMQVLGALPSIQLDKVDGATIFLGRESLNTELFTSKCSGINMVLPAAEEGEDYDTVECPVPDQIRTWVEGGKLMSEIVKQEG